MLVESASVVVVIVVGCEERRSVPDVLAMPLFRASSPSIFFSPGASSTATTTRVPPTWPMGDLVVVAVSCLGDDGGVVSLLTVVRGIVVDVPAMFTRFVILGRRIFRLPIFLVAAVAFDWSGSTGGCSCFDSCACFVGCCCCCCGCLSVVWELLEGEGNFLTISLVIVPIP